MCAGALALLLVLVCAATSANARSAASRLTPAERAAVHAYLIDRYEYAQATAEAAPVVLAAYEAEARGLAAECPNALAGAPQEAGMGGPPLQGGPFAKPHGARQHGEERRQRIQLSDLEGEIDTLLGAAALQPLLPAKLALLAKLKALPASPPALATVVEGDVGDLQEKASPVPAACADIGAWAASGYRSLSPASRAIALHAEAEAAGLPHVLRQLGVEPLAPLEDATDRALAEKTIRIELRAAKTTVDRRLLTRRRLEAALGLKVETPPPKETTTTIRIGTVRTAAGGRYTVSVDRTKGGSGCKAQVQIRPAEGGVPGVLAELFAVIKFDSVYCLADGPSATPRAECAGGLIEIRARPLPATRRVVLRLSDGRRIVSRPVLVPARLGGPAAIYFQALRGPSPIPVSLQELDARGRVLRTEAVPRVLECSAQSFKYVRGGKITLAHGRTPQGPEFSIVGERYRFAGRLYTELALGTGPEAPEPEPESEPPPVSLAGLPRDVREQELLERRKPLRFTSMAGCRPHEFSIVIGLLKRPGDTALAEVAGKLAPMSRVRIPASLHMHGVLVYLASESRPERILVRAPSGRIQMRENLRSQAVEQRETCEGESEGPGPAPGGLESIAQTTSLALGS